MASKMNNRLKREFTKLKQNPPEGIFCNINDENTNLLLVNIVGPEQSPYAGTVFEIEVEVDDSYPFAPPRMKFITPIYHPNIDTGGRICLDLLKMPPAGGWMPLITLENLLVAVRSLLASPNPDDPLMPEIATEFRCSKKVFERNARLYTQAKTQKKAND